MNDINSGVIVGRLTRDVEEPKGSGPARFSIAVNRRVKDGEEWKDEASFFDVEHWHRTILQYLKKGKQIAITYELKQDRWTDKESGQARSKLVICARDIQLLGGGGQSENRPQNQPPATPKEPPKEAEKQAEFDDDIPF